jgi:hypothetical protein
MRPKKIVPKRYCPLGIYNNSVLIVLTEVPLIGQIEIQAQEITGEAVKVLPQVCS